MIYSILALRYLGYPLDHPVIAKGLKAIEDFCMEDEQGRRMRRVSRRLGYCFERSGLTGCRPASRPSCIAPGCSWLVSQQIMTGGDWQVKNCCPPGGWAFEFVNNQYPDVDDSAVVLSACSASAQSQRWSRRVKQRGMIGS